MGQENEQRDWVQELKDGKVELDQVPSNILDQVVNGEINLDEEASTPEQEEVEQVSESTPEAETEVQQEEAPTPENEEAWYKSKNYQLANELNTERQRRESHERKLREDPLYREKYFKEMGIEVNSNQATEESTKEQNLDEVDVYDEDVLKSTLKELNELKAWKRQQEQEKASQAYDAKLSAEQQAQRERIQMISDKAAQVADLQTSRPFTELNTLVEAGAKTPEALKQHGVSDLDIQKLSKIYAVANGDVFKQSNDFDYALFKSQYTPSMGSPAVDPVQQKAQQMMQSKQQEISNQTETMSVPRGNQGFGSEANAIMSVEKAGQIIRSLENKDLNTLTPDQRSDMELAFQILGVN